MHAKAVDFAFHTVSDIDEAVSFYRNTLGLELETFQEDVGWAEFALPPTTLALGEDNSAVALSPGAGGVGVSMAVDDVGAAVEELDDEDLDVLMEPAEFPTCDMAMVADPDDNPIMLHRRSDGTHGRRDPFP